jgi:hypothetical protein
MVLILRAQGVEKSLLEISPFNLSTDIFGVLKKFWSAENKFFANRSNSHSMVHTNTF